MLYLKIGEVNLLDTFFLSQMKMMLKFVLISLRKSIMQQDIGVMLGG